MVCLIDVASSVDLQIMQMRRAFSLVELVIVVVIMGIIAAIAVPRMSNSAENAAKNAVIGNQAALQTAIDLYTAEHEGQLLQGSSCSRFD